MLRHALAITAILIALYLGAIVWRQSTAGTYFDRLHDEINLIHLGKMKLYEAEIRRIQAPAKRVTAAAVGGQPEAQRTLEQVLVDVSHEASSFVYQIEQVRQHRAYARRHLWNPYYDFQKHDIMSVAKAL
jgi:hypothetical protein